MLRRQLMNTQAQRIGTDPPANPRAILRDGGRPLLVILIVAVVLRITFVSEFLASNPLSDTLISDARLYHDQATRIAQGDLLGANEPYHHPPLYPYIVGFLYALFGAHPEIVILFQSALGQFMLLLVYGLCRQYASRSAALIATASLLFALPLVFFETRLLPASLAVFVATAALWRAASGAVFSSALLFGVLATLRPNQLLTALLVLTALSGGGRRGQKLAVAVLGLAIPILPFFLRNVMHAGEPVLLCDSGGINLHLANNPDAGVSFRTLDVRFGEVADQPAVARAIAQAEAGEPLSHAEVSAHFRDKALRYAVRHPDDEALLLLRRALAFFQRFEYGVIYTPAAEAGAQRTSTLFFLPAAVLLALAAFAVVGRGSRGSRDTRRPIAPLVLFIAAQFITVLLFYQYARFRVVMMAAIPALVAIGIDRFRAHGPRPVTAMAAVAILLVLAFVPPPEEARRQVANGHATLAEAYLARGDHASARREVDSALAADPDFARARAASAAVSLASGDAAGALAQLEDAARRWPTQPFYLNQLARFLIESPTHRDFARARDLARSSIEAGPGIKESHVLLGLALLNLSNDRDQDEALAALHTATSLPPEDGESWFYLGVALLRTGQADRMELAEQAFLRAAAVEPTSLQPRIELVRLLRSQGRAAESAAHLDAIRATDPDHPVLRQ